MCQSLFFGSVFSSNECSRSALIPHHIPPMRSEDLNPRRTPPPAAGIFDHDDMAPQRENELLPVSQAVSSQVGPATGVT